MNMQQETITIVSGLPRSGTSMMMKILEAGGLEVLTDGLRTADEDNPKGYYEFERVKKLKEDKEWLDAAKGKVVKIISALLKDLPDAYQYNIVFMRRRMKEILASQKKMLVRRGEPTDRTNDEKMTEVFESHLKQVEDWLNKKQNMNVIYVTYHEVLENPENNIKQVNEFLGHILDEDKMMKAIDDRLYRNRA